MYRKNMQNNAGNIQNRYAISHGIYRKNMQNKLGKYLR